MTTEPENIAGLAGSGVAVAVGVKVGVAVGVGVGVGTLEKLKSKIYGPNCIPVAGSVPDRPGTNLSISLASIIPSK
ncbi:MAG: hypothetical protein FI718_06505 [SAR202 cluster bacterium]|nr:hypothetical protein [SAR202 cluster bacterium]